MYNYNQWQHVHFISHNDKITSVHSINNQLLIIIYLPTICSLGVYVVFDTVILYGTGPTCGWMLLWNGTNEEHDWGPAPVL
jgi:hypothetical protein